MKLWHKAICILLAVAFAATMLAGCKKDDKKTQDQPTKEASSTSEEKKDDEKKDAPAADQKTTAGDTVTFALWSDPSYIFNPLLSNTKYDEAVNAAVYASLLQVDKDLALAPYLAESYEANDAEKTLRFTLKKDLKWQDGEPLTVDDVIFTFEALSNPDYKGEIGSYATGISSIKADGNVITISFDEVTATALNNLGLLQILPKHIWSKIPMAEWEKSEQLKNPIGAGPFKLVGIKNGQEIDFEAFDDFVFGAPKAKKLVYKIMTPENAYVELEKGDLDIAEVTGLSQETRDQLTKSGVTFTEYPSSGIQYLGFNMRDTSVTSNKDIRKAIAYAIDRQAMIDGLLGGKGILANAPMVPTSWAYPDESDLIQYTPDPAKVEEYMTKAGYKKNAEGVYAKDGKPLVIHLDYPSGDPTREKSAQLLQSMLSAQGITMELNMLDFPGLMSKVVGNHNFEAYLMANTLVYEPDPYPYWHSKQSSDEPETFAWNMTGFRNPEADALLEKALRTTDREERRKDYTKFEQILNEELPWIVLYVPEVVVASGSHVQGFSGNTFDTFHEMWNWAKTE